MALLRERRAGPVIDRALAREPLPAPDRHVHVLGGDLNTEEAPVPAFTGNQRGTGSREDVQHGLAWSRAVEQAPLDQLDRLLGGVEVRGSRVAADGPDVALVGPGVPLAAGVQDELVLGPVMGVAKPDPALVPDDAGIDPEPRLLQCALEAGVGAPGRAHVGRRALGA